MPKGAEQFTDSEGVYLMTHPLHTLVRTSEHYDYTLWICENCEAEKMVGTGKLLFAKGGSK